VLIALLGACGGGTGLHAGGAQQDGSQRVAPAWPAFPGEGAPGGVSPARKTSGAVSINGDGWAQQAGTGNYADTLVPNAYVIVPGGDEDLPLAWALYTVPGLDAERPVRLDLHVTAAPIAPGGDEDLPLSYWVGVSDYTLFTWQWSGPYAAPGQMSITLNDKQTDVLDRYVSADTAGSTFHLVIATLAQAQFITPQNPKGLTAARIETLTVNTLAVDDPAYAATRPHYTPIEDIGGGGKGGSALDPSQYVTLTWTHVFDPANPDCEAIQYKLYRQGPMDAQRIPIGSVNAPAPKYVDPTDNSPGVADSVPGATYSYWLRAYNPQGYTPFVQSSFTIPLLGPTNVQATDGRYENKIVLTWTKAEAATGYKIYRDGQTEAELIATVADVDTREDSSISDYDVHTYWLRSTNQYMPDGGDWSQAELGHCVQVGPGDWWVFGRDRRHTRCSPFTGPATSALKWSYFTAGGVGSSPAIGADGTVYVGSSVSSNDGLLYAIYPDGSLKWSFATGRIGYSSPAIGADGTVYVGSDDGLLYAIYPDGSLKWSYTTGAEVESSPAIGADGTVYVGSSDYKLYAINPDGSLKWAYATEGAIGSSPAIAADGTVYVGSYDNKLYAINPDGSLKWAYDTGAGTDSSPAIGTDGTVYVANGPDLFAINPDGSFKWVYVAGYSVDSSPAIGADGTVYVGSHGNSLYAINPGGSVKWDYWTEGEVYSSPAIGADGTVYVGCNDYRLYAINPDGSLKWAYTTGNWVGSSSPAIGADGTVYVGSCDGKLYAIGPGGG
jgi:outer membrane protein assembly factor BamB